MNIKDFMPCVRLIAFEIHRQLPANIQLDDLIQDGMIGLIMAFRQYDANSGVLFKTFAWNKIRWAIKGGLRNGDWAERSVRRSSNKVAKTIEQLQASLQREPSKSEIADALGLRVSDISSIMGEAYGYNFVSINDCVEGEALDIPDSRNEPSVSVERREEYSRVLSCLKTLPAKQRQAFILVAMSDMSGRQAAREMGLSESRVSQLYKAATEKIASYITHGFMPSHVKHQIKKPFVISTHS
jgi:RNA polymerase sigma factor FliA